MQKSIISWTNVTWNPISGCSKVSDGCAHCYAMKLSNKYGWTTKPWTIQNEAENVVMKPHKLKEPYLLKEPSRIFTNSMSDMFHRVLPDWYIAAMFAVMLSTPQHVYQVLTKRPERTVDWPERYQEAIRTPEFDKLTAETKNKNVRIALEYAGECDTPWGDNIWMGTSVEDARVTHRIDTLRQSQAVTKFISAEPLLGSFGQVDFSGIDWVIVGGESGDHLTGPEHPRWMKMEWAREIKEQCVAQNVAYFFKQDSGKRTEQRPWLVEEDGLRWEWHQYPGNLVPPVNLDAPQPPAPTVVKPTTVVSFRDVKEHWHPETQTWDEGYVYIGRASSIYKLPESKWRNPYPIAHGRDESTEAARIRVIGAYRQQLLRRPELIAQIDELRGKTLVCWCRDAKKPQACHGDVLLELLNEKPAEEENQPVQLMLI